MRLTSRRTLSLAILLVLALILVGCAGRAPAATQAVSETPPAEALRKGDAVTSTSGLQGDSLVTAASEKLASDGPTLDPNVSGNVEFWHFWASPVRNNALRRVISLCQQKLPNITISESVKPFGDIWTANIAAVAAGTGIPDVIVSDRRNLPRDAADGIYTSLQTQANRDNVRRDQFYDWAWDQAVYQGGIYGIPHETDVTVLFYNKNLFRQAGLDPSKPPTTWADLEAYADKLDRIGADGELERVAFFPLWRRGAEVWQFTNDADMIRADGTPQLDNPNMVETVEWIKKWVDRYGGWDKLQNFVNQFGEVPNDPFMTSSVAMYVDIFGYNSQLQFHRPMVTLDNGGKERMDWGIALLPNNTKAGTWSGGFSLSIPTGAKNPQAAWEFIKCATSSEGQVSWARDTQAQPTNLKAATDPSLLADPAWQIVDEALKSSTGGVYIARYPNWAEQLSQRWQMVWRGELSAAQMLSEAQKAVEEAIE